MPMHLIAEDGPLCGIVLELETGEEWILGRDAEACTFPLEDSTVSRKHARIFRTKEGFFLENLSQTNPTEVNEKALSEPLLLKEGDRIKIGDNLFRFQEEATLAEAPPKKKKKEAPPEEETPAETIFEEAVEVEIPIAAERTFILKVLAGPNTGAEFSLEKGKSYLLGKDLETSDILLNDLSVSREHARLFIDADGNAEIEDLGSTNGTFVNGLVIPLQQKQKLLSQDLVTLGTTTFTLLGTEAVAKTLYTPPPISKAEEKVEEEKATPIDWKKKIIPPKFLILSTVLVGLLFFLFLGFFALFQSEKIEIAKVDPTKELKTILDPYEDVRFSFNPSSGKLFLIGHVLTPVEKQELLFSLKELPFLYSIEDTLIIDELVWKNMNDILNDNPMWRGISIHSPKAGKFIATGYIQTLEQAQKLNDYLNTNFPYLDRLDNQVTIETVLQTQISTLLLSKGFESVAFQLSNGEVILSGRYNMENEEGFLSLLKEMKVLPGVRSVKNFSIATSPQNARINLSERYRISGYALQKGESYSIVVNGQIVTVGDLLDGMRITSIEKSVILLEKDGLKYKINYSR